MPLKWGAKPNTTCDVCGAPVYKSPSRLRKSGGQKYCSRLCRAKNQGPETLAQATPEEWRARGRRLASARWGSRVSFFSEATGLSYDEWTKVRGTKRAAKWRKTHPLLARQIRNAHYARRKAEAIEAYGGKCACCGENNPAFLTFDHIAGGGTRQRREIGRGGNNLIRWLRKENYPLTIQLLCANCNMAKGIQGVCPHQSLSEAADAR